MSDVPLACTRNPSDASTCGGDHYERAVAQKPIMEKKSCTAIQKLAVHVDTVIVLLLDLDDTRYVLLEDAHKFHRISAHYLCTDKLLNGFSAAVIHPAAKGSHDRMLGFLRDRLGWKGFCFQHSVLSTTHCVNS